MIEITWLGHGTYQFRLQTGEVILVDPWIDGNPSYPAGYEVDRCDVLLLTHGHFDHIAGVESLAARFQPQVVAIYELASWLEGKGVGKTMGMNIGGTAQAGPISATMTTAVHSSSFSEDGRIVYLGEPAGFVVHFPDGRRAYLAGDTTVFGDMRLIHELYQPQLAVLPIGDFYTMGPREAALACKLLDVGTVIPVHWGTFPPLIGRPDKLRELLRSENVTGTEVLALEPGKPVRW